MKAMVIQRYGTAQELEIIELPKPQPGTDDLLVRVICSSVNPADIRARSPGDNKRILRQFPVILGYDVSGIVEAVGANVNGFAPGDEVFGSPGLLKQGANAEYVLLDYRTVARKPSVLSFEEAAALSLAGTTALECLERGLRMTPSDRILIHAGAGGVGHLQIQLAKALGLQVWATAGRDETVQFCEKLGADVVLDYRKRDFVSETQPAGVSLIMDNVGGGIFERSMEALAPLGTLVSIAPTSSERVAELMFLKAATLIYHVMGASTLWGLDMSGQGQALGRLLEKVLNHGIRPHIGATYPIRDLATAHARIESGRTVGKIVIQVEDAW